MPRTARIVIPGVPHHVTQRGNNKQDVFFTPEDRRVYLSMLRNFASRLQLKVMGYCLMSNHVHLVAIPPDEKALARVLGRVHFLYAQHVNDTYGRSGHLWQNRFHSCALDEQHFWAALRYIEQNPLRAGLTGPPWEYAWSSAAGHIGEKDATGLMDAEEWRRMMSPEEWKGLLGGTVAQEQLGCIRTSTLTGRPAGCDAFIARLEAAFGRRLRPLPGGRPKRKPGTVT